MSTFKLVSADGHVTEPPCAWERVQKEYGERAPRVVKDPPGVAKGTWLLTEGLPPMGISHFAIGVVLQKPDGVSDIDAENYAKTINFNEAYRFEDFPEGWDPAARLKAQDRDGVAAEVLFASPGRFFYGLTDAAFQRAVLNSYNFWLHDFCSHDPRRLIGMPLLSILDIDRAVEDIGLYAKLGFRALQIPTGIKGSGYYEPRYEPLWAAAEDAGMVLNVHTTSVQGEVRSHFEGPRRGDPRTAALGPAVSRLAPGQTFMGHMIFSGVFDRHPGLKVVLAEYDIGWVGHLYQQADYEFRRASAYDPERDVNRHPPTHYLDRNIFFTFQDDRSGALTTPVYGENNYLWASDFPHGVTTWPYSQRTVERNFEGVDEAVKRRICRDNAIQLYRLDLPGA